MVRSPRSQRINQDLPLLRLVNPPVNFPVTMYFLLLFGIELLILLRRHPELFLKRPEKAGIILKPVHKTGFADTRAAADRVPAHPNPFFQDELVDGKPQICLKYMGNMVFADIKFPGQPFKRKILFNVFLDIPQHTKMPCSSQGILVCCSS